jgi:NADPH-dependent 2,4-dienoyl-CoA reductase/sulfur reductase-like enzyme
VQVIHRRGGPRRARHAELSAGGLGTAASGPDPAARAIDVILKTEVLIIGSGPGGWSAALAPARAGAETALVDSNGCFGGNVTQVGVVGCAWYGHEHTADRRSRVRIVGTKVGSYCANTSVRPP